jgi:release factor glutamine methyltransferase
VDWIIQSTKSEVGNMKLKVLDIEREAVVSLFHWLKIYQMPKYMRFVSRLSTAKKNAVINQVDVTFIEQNILETADLNQQFIIVSNPPYSEFRETRNQEECSRQRTPFSSLLWKMMMP